MVLLEAGFFHALAVFAAMLAKISVTVLGVLFGAVFLMPFVVIAVIGIGVISAMRGWEHRSLLKATGTFFRLAGILMGLVVASLAIPIAIAFKVSILGAFGLAAILIGLGYFAGFIVSEYIAFRLWTHEIYIRGINAFFQR